MVDTRTPASTRHDGSPPRSRSRWRAVLSLIAAAVAGAVLATAVLLGLDWRGAGGGGQAESDPGGGQSAARSGAGDELTWAPPELDDPVTVKAPTDGQDLHLDLDQDYIIEMPDEPLDVRGGLVVNGGRNVVLIGGEIRISESGDRAQEIRGLYLRKQTGTIHVEGLHITGAALGEGINLDQREGATVQLQNILVDTVDGERDGHHADLLQTWAGPSVLRIDRLTGRTTYQGFFLLPKQFLEEEPERFDLRRVNIHGVGDAAYLLWRDGADWPIDVQDVWVAPSEDDDRTEDDDVDAFTWAKGDDPDAWGDVRVGTPPGGDFVTEDRVGLGYESPGYAEDDGR